MSPFSNGFKSLLLSGGMDTKLCSYSIEEFARTRPSWVLPVSATGLVQSSVDYTTVAVRHRNRLDIWNVLPSPLNLEQGQSLSGQKRKGGDDITTDKESEEDSIDDDSRCKLALRLETKGPEHIHCFALSNDGAVVACSTVTETRVWSLTSDSAGVIVNKLVLPQTARGFCHALAFSADGKRLAAYTAKGSLLLLALEEVLMINKEGFTGSDDDEAEHEDNQSELLENSDDEMNNSDDDDDVDAKEKSNKSKRNGTDIDMKTVSESENNLRQKELQVRLWHSFDHSSVVTDMQDKTSPDTSRNPRGLSQAVTKIVFSTDGMYLAVADAQNGVYIYDIDR